MLNNAKSRAGARVISECSRLFERNRVDALVWHNLDGLQHTWLSISLRTRFSSYQRPPRDLIPGEYLPSRRDWQVKSFGRATCHLIPFRDRRIMRRIGRLFARVAERQTQRT